MLYNSRGIALHFISRRFAVAQQRDKLRPPREKGRTIGPVRSDGRGSRGGGEGQRQLGGRTEAAQ